MADGGVGIPVYVDIQGAFDRAVREIPKEMPKLEKVLSRNALSIKIDMGGGSMNTVRNLLTDTTMSAGDLEHALKRVRKAFDEAVAKGANKTKTSATVNNLAKAYGLLEQRVKGFYNSNNVAAMRLEDTIAKVSYKINDMKAKLSGLRVGSEQYNKINYELQIQRKRLADLTLQQMQYKAGIDASTSAYHKQAGIVKQLTGYFSGLYAVHSLVRFVKQVRDVTGELEYQRVALGHLLQDADFGNELFAKTIEAAKESPFRIGQLVIYTKQLAAYRIEQENLFDTTQRLADISAGLGVDMNRLILAYGQVRAASVLRGQELRQFTEAGIPLVELLAEKFRELGREGTTTADVFKLISERAVPFEYIKEIFEDLTNAGGMFYKMQEEQAKTLKGRWEKLKDAYDQALMSLGDSSAFQSWNDTILNILNGLAKNLNGIVRVVNAASMAWAAYWVTTKSGLSYGVRLTGMFIKEYGAVTTLKFGVAGLTAAFQKLWLAMKSNWVGLALSAVAGVVTYFTTFKNKTKEATGELSDMQKAIEQMKDANKEFEYGKGLVASYEELAKKTDRTSRESERMLDTINELERTFPGLTDKINNDNLSLEERIGIMREAVNASHDLAVEEAKNRLNTQNEIIRGLEDQEKAARLVKESAQRRLEAAQTAEKVGIVPLSQRYGPGTYDTAEDLKNKTIEAANAAKKADDAYEDVATSLATARREAEQLRKLAFPEDVKNAMAEWQNLLIGASKYTSEGIPKLLFTEKDVQGWDSLGEAIKKLKPQFEEARKTYVGLVSAVKEGGALVRPELTKDRDAAGDTFAAWQALDALLGGLLSKAQSKGSDKRLSNLKKDISEITDAYKKFLELRKYMTDQQALDEIGVLFPQLKGFRPDFKNTIGRLSTMLDDVRAKLAKSPKDRVLLDMQRTLEKEISDLRFDDIKTEIENRFKKLSDDMKRSETIRNFYKDILDATGDEQVATNMTVSVYGNLGQDFRDRLQKSMIEAINALDTKEISDDARFDFLGDITLFNIDAIKKNLDKLPPKTKAFFEELLKQNEEYNAQWEKDFIKRYQKTKTYAERIATLENQRTAAEKEAGEMGKSPAEIAAVTAYWDKQIANVQLEALKDTYTWTKAFEDLEGVSSDTLQNLIKLIDEYITKNGKGLEPQQLKELTRAKERAKQQYIERDAIKSARKAFDDLTKARGRSFSLLLKGQKGTEDYTRAMDDAMEAAKRFAEAVEKLESDINSLISTSKDLFSTFASDKDAQYFSEQMENLSKAIGGGAKVAIGAARIGAGDVTGVMQLISGLGDFISGIGGGVNSSNLHRLNEQIEDQTHLIENLEYAYSRLETAMADSFGSDYVYNYQQQLANLEAVQAAYEEQARLEREKGKKADEEKIREYERAATETADKIAEKRSELAEFFTGADITSAAKDFASAWIEAYKQFGSTTDAMKEKFHDMIESMVTQSLAAKMVQEILDPLFREINTMTNDAEGLTATEIAEIARKAPEYYAQIDAALTQLMAKLGAAGLNIRDKVGSFTGISRNIANASEESINGLAAGINTQNFYMQHIDMNVAAILATLTGGASSAGASQSGEYADPYKDQMLLYAGHIPTIDQNLASLLSEVRKVVKPRGTTATHYVAVNM